MGFWFNGSCFKVCTAAAFQESEIIQQPLMIKTRDGGVDILDHVFMKGLRICLQSVKEMKGLSSLFNFSCGQTEIKNQSMLQYCFSNKHYLQALAERPLHYYICVCTMWRVPHSKHDTVSRERSGDSFWESVLSFSMHPGIWFRPSGL